MADSTPPLLQSDSATEPETPVLNEPPPSIDWVIQQFTESFGNAQFMQTILVGFSRFFDGQQTFISIYTDAKPTWHCSASINTTCNSSSNICNLPKSAFAWDNPSHKTIISDWDLQCASSFITSLPASSFFIGCLIGGFALATIADTTLGRKKLLSISVLTMCVAAFGTSFSTNIWIYSALRFVSGCGRASIGSSSLVLITEKVANKWRGKAGTTAAISFTLGFLSLPGIAYINRGSSWSRLYMWTSIPGIIYSVLMHFFVLESPRWLFMKGRSEEAIRTLKKIAPKNHSSQKLCFKNYDPKKEETTKDGLYSSIKSLFKRKWAVKRLLIVNLLGFGVGMVYYSMPLGVGNLGFNIYLSVVFNALSEIPAFMLFFFIVSKWNRKYSLLAFSVLSGVCSIMCAVISNDWKGAEIGLELVSFFGVCIAFAVLMIFTIELFPTCVRNFTGSLVRQALVLGAAFSPILISAGSKNKIFSFGVFGVVILCCGFLVFGLPETRDAPLWDTMEEQERKDVVIV